MKRYLSLLIILIFFICNESVGQLFSNTGSLTGITTSSSSEVSIDKGSAKDWDGNSKYGCSFNNNIIIMKKKESWFKFGFNVSSGYGVSGQFDARASHVHAVDYAYLEVYYRVTGDCKFDPLDIGINGWMLWGKFKVSGASCNTYDLPDIPAKITGGQPLEICFFYDGNGNFSDFIGIDNIKIDQSNYSAPPDVNSNPYIENFESAKWWAAGGYMGYPSTGNTGSEVYMPYHTETSNAASAFLNTGGPSHDPDNPKLNDENAKYSPSSNCVDFQAPPNSTTDNCNIGGGAPNNMKIIAPELNTTTCSKGAELRFAFQACYPQNPTGTAPNLNYQSLPNEQYRDYCPQIYCGTGTGSNIKYTKVNDAYIHYYFPQGTWWYCTVELPKDKALKILIASSVMTGTAGTCYNSIDNIKVFCRDCTIDQYIGGAVSGASWVYSNTTYDYSINPYSHKYNNQNDSIKPSFYKWYVRKIFDNTSQQTTYTNADPPGYGECGTGEPCITSGQGTTSCTINFGTAGHYRILCIPYDDDPGTQDKPNIDVCAAAMSFKDIYACPVDLGSNITITTGGSTVLKPNGPGAGATYLWSDGSTGSSLTVKPAIATTYSVTTTINGCSDRDTVVVNVGNASCIADAGADKTICSGGSTILSAIGGNSYSWDNYLGADSTLNVYPTATTTYTVTATTGGTCTASDQVVITVSSLKVDAGADQTISAGSAVSLTATGSGGTPAYSYSWSDGKGGAWTSQSINPKPAGPLTYRVTITDSDAMVCTYNDSVHVCILTANAGPDQTINSGESATLTVTTTCGTSYLWDDPLKGTTATITVSPTVTTTYHVTVKGGTTAQATDDIVVTVIPAAKCKVEINSPNQTICQGDSISLIGSVTKGTGPFTYVWDDGSGQVGNTAAIYGIYPTRTSTFTLSVTFGDGCTASAKLLITLSDLAVDAGSDIIAEKGKSITLTATATGGVKPYDLYSWKSSDGTDYGSGQSNNLAIAPYASQKMYVAVYDANACAANDSLSICVLTVDAGPDVNISKGQSTTLSATPSCPGSGYTYKWDNGAPAVQNPKVTPPVTTTYVVTVTAPGGATAIDTVVVNVSSCAVDAGLPQTICSGDTATLTATPTGFTSPAYSWSNGLANVGNTQSISVNPAKTTTYYVTVTDNSGTCNVPASVVVNISDLKVVARNDTIVNKSVTFTLNCVASGGTFQYSYSWVSTTGSKWEHSTNSAQNTKTIVSKGYIVTVTDTILGCTASDEMYVCVLTVDAGPDQTISNGQSTSLDATPDCIINGYTYTYSWDNGAAGVQSPTVSPATTTIYTVTLTATKGTVSFTATDKVTVTVTNAPVCSVDAGANQTVCKGNPVTMTAAATGGAATFSWNNALSNAATLTVTPAGTQTYYVTATVGACTAKDSIVLTVSNPGVDIGLDMTVSSGVPTTLTATPSGGTSTYNYSWTTKETTQSIIVKPTTSTTYFITVRDNGNTACVAKDSIALCVLTATSGGDKTINNGDSVQIEVINSCGTLTYLWDKGAGTTQNPYVKPTTTTTYKVTVKDPDSKATATASVVVTVGTCSVDAGKNLTSCKGDSVTLNATSNGTGVPAYKWSNGLGNTATVKAYPASNSTYYVTVTFGACTASDLITITLSDPVVEAGPDQIVESAAPTTLSATATGGTSTYLYSWSVAGGNNKSVVVNPTSSIDYFVTVRDQGNTACKGIDSMHVCILTAISGGDKTIASGNSTSITVSSLCGTGLTYSWDNGAGTTQTPTVKPTNTTTYKVTVTAPGGVTATTTVIVTVTTCTVDAGLNSTICRGDSAVLIAKVTTGAASYSWNNGNMNDTMIVKPLITTIYKVTANIGGCTAMDTVVVTVSNPIVDAGLDTIISAGSSASLTAKAAGGTGIYNYSWSAAAGKTQTVTVRPANPATYFITATDNANTKCKAVDSVHVCVLNADAGQDQTITSGTSATLGVTSKCGTGLTYSWDNGTGTTQNPTVKPTTNTTYHVTVKAPNGAMAVDTVVVYVNPPGCNISVSLGTDRIISGTKGDTLKAIANGGSDYKYIWSTGTTDTLSTKFVTPSQTSTYKVTVTSGGCTAINRVVLCPLMADAGDSVTIKVGDSTKLMVTTPCNSTYTYAWSDDVNKSAGNTVNPEVKPNTRTMYTVTVTAPNGVTATDKVVVNVIQCKLTVDLGPDTVATSGKAFVLTANAKGGIGNLTYSWAPGNYNTPAITITPTSSTTYSVTVIDSLGCFAKDNVGVCALTLKISNDTTIMAGDTAKLWTEPLCGGNYTYAWSGGGNTPNIKVNPTTTTTYIVTVTGPGGATATADVVVIVKKCNLTVNLTASDTVISVGAATIIKANVSGVAGPLTYKWNTTPVKTTQQITVKPNVSSTYIVTVNDGTCDVTADIPVCVLTANAGPDITITQGSDTTLTVTAPCGNITAYSWSSGSTQQNPKVKPTVTTTYIVIITDKTGATAIDTVIVYVSQCFVDAGPDQTICKNTCVTLKANCGLCDSKMWSTGETTDSITVCPLKTTKYYVTATLKTCTHVDSVEISISPDYLKLTPSNAVICMGDSTDIMASGIKTFLWNTKETTRIINVIPKITSTYSVTGKNQNGCVESGDIQIQVNNLPIASAGGNKTICKNSQGSLTASGGFKYLWSNSDSTQTITVSPVQTSTYIVTVSDNIGCSSTASAVITVNWVNVSAGSDTLICNGDCATLKSIVSSNDTIDQIIQIWSNGTTGPGITVCPKDTTKYTVSVIDGNNCRSSAGVIVNVRTVKAIITDTLVVCENAKKVVLPASSNIPGATYSWTGPNGFSSPPKTAEIDTVNSSGDYVVIAKAFNCSSLPETLHVKMTALPLKPVVHTDTVCEGQTLRLSIDPVANAKYIWTGPALSKPDSSNPLIIKNSKVINSGNYSASVIIENCKSDTATKTAKVLPKPIAIFAPSIDKGDIPLDVTFINSSWNASKYLWDFGDETTATVKNPVHTYTTAGSFKVFLTAMNALGCDTIAEYTFIRVDNSSILYIPNAFTPNGDLDNDLFQIKGVGINKFDGYIFDRWGVQLYEWHDIKGGWDGTYQGNVVKQDVYLYKIKAEGVNKVVYQKSGTVTLIR